MGSEKMVEMSPKLQNQIAQYQQIQQQLQMVMAQKGQYSMQLEEVERSLEELGKAGPETPTYRNVGSLLIRVETPWASRSRAWSARRPSSRRGSTP
jgi:prefoldin beta subunit